jgi:hypothetical protein
LEDGSDFGDNVGPLGATAFLPATVGGELPENPLHFHQVALRSRFLTLFSTGQGGDFVHALDFTRREA